MFFKNFWPAILWAIVIFVLCSTPGKSIPSTDWLRWVNFDKWVHAFLYFVLFIACYWGFKNYNGNWRTYFIISLLVCVLYGIGIELLQAFFLIDRSGDIPDALANTMGSVFAVFGIRLWVKAWPWEKKKVKI
jgi:glycopeptide antibiotics resistance protein